jgi:UDP-glucose 4-epimerase
LANVLITGGSGFIGSHTTLSLLERGWSVCVIDNFANSGPESLRRVAGLAGLRGWQARSPLLWASNPGEGSLTLLQGDVRNPADLNRAFRVAEEAGGPIEAVLHFAGLKAVGESVSQPLRYWDVNVAGSLCLLETMRSRSCHTLVFSSSATLYGYPATVPIRETAAVQPINPYGTTKAAVEQMLADLATSEPHWRIACLRYFNPVGAHPSGQLGEDPQGIPNNLFPLISQVAIGRRPHLQVFGSDWPTPDGTGIRDYIHVMDLAEGHAAALGLLLSEPPQRLTLNLGSGCGHSVLDLVRTFSAVSGCAIPYEFTERRAGDSAISIADPAEAMRRLGWHTRRTLEDCCRDGWAWQRAHPHGYGVAAAEEVGTGRSAIL